ncbi:MAG: carboxypeptidase-like regulatory domain-containing protein, partial [Candidatus Acidiferrales bacterium]
MKRFTATVQYLAVVFGLLALAAPSRAQLATGTMSGNVVDPSGAAVPGATVSATNVETKVNASAQTDNAGNFKLSYLPVGKYTVKVSKSGFRSIEIGSVSVLVNSDFGLGAIQLELGTATTTVEVTAAPPLVESTTSQISTTFTGQDLQTFSGVSEQEGLDFLALQVPGVVNNRELNFANYNGVGFAVNGIRGRANDQQVDGENNNDNSVTGPALFVENVDWVSEYQIVTNNFGAEYGRNAGSVVDEITKSGTNTWHGTASAVETNSVLQTLTNQEKYFEDLTKLPRYNEIFPSMSIGGPLWKNKIFVFGGFDVQYNSSSYLDSTGGETPTPAGQGELAGCFPGSASVAALLKYGPYAIGGGNPTVLPGSAMTVDYTDVPVPVPNDGGAGCNVELGGVERLLGNSYHEYDWIYKVDVVLSNADRFFGRYMYQKELYTGGDDGYGPVGYPYNVPALSQLMLLDWTHVFSGRAVNDFRVSYGRENVEFGGNSLGNTIPLQQNLGNALSEITFSDPNLIGFGVQNIFPQGRIVNTYQVQDNFSFTLGKHQFKAGFNGTNQRSPNVYLPNYNGTYTFTDWGTFAANTPSSVGITQGTPNLNFREYDTFLYFQDDWKIKENLTLNLGLTWTYFGQPANLFTQLDKAQQTSSDPFWLTSLPNSVTEFQPLPSNKHLFGPNIGFAYTPRFWQSLLGDNKTVIRGGYRLAYDPPFYNFYVNLADSSPQALAQTLSAPAVTPPGLLANPTGVNERAALTSFLSPGVYDPRTFDEAALTPNFGADKVQSWSLGIQRQLTKDLAAEVRYVGNHGANLFQAINGNPYIAGLASAYPSLIPAGVTPCSAPAIPEALGRVNCNEGIVYQYANTGYSNYNGLQTQLRATNLFRQLTLNTAYTRSKTLDNTSEVFSTFGAGNSTWASQNPLNNKGAEYGISGIDFPNNWTIGFTEQIPAFRSQQGVVGHILGGWAVAGNYAISSGQAYTPSQFELNYFSGGVANDTAFDLAEIGTFETSRPFWGTPSAPASQVGILAGDACSLYGADCLDTPSNLLSLNSLNTTGAVTPVTKSQVRYIVNG